MLMSTSNQVYIFLSAVYMGIIIGFIYDIYRVVRILSNPTKLVTGIMDILFWVTVTLLSIIGFFYVSSGEIRLYNIIGLAIGWMLYLLTLSRYIIRLLKIIFAGFIWMCKKTIELLAYPFQMMIDILEWPKILWEKSVRSRKDKLGDSNVEENI